MALIAAVSGHLVGGVAGSEATLFLARRVSIR
jgi:hypothetical protein